MHDSTFFERVLVWVRVLLDKENEKRLTNAGPLL